MNIKKMFLTSAVTVCLLFNFAACSMGSGTETPDSSNTSSQNNSGNGNDLTTDDGKPNDTVDNNTENLKEDIKDGVNDIKNGMKDTADDMKDTANDVKDSVTDGNKNN